jgi:hypothetical protein
MGKNDNLHRGQDAVGNPRWRGRGALATFFIGVILVYLTASCGGGGGGSAPVLFFTLANLVNAIVGQAYDQTLSVSGGTGTHTWTLTGALPAGLTFCPANGDAGDTTKCTLSGTPTLWSGSRIQFTISVTDSSNPPKAGQKTYTIQVDPAGGALQIQTASLPNSVIGSAYNSSIISTGGQAPYTWSITTGALPPGISFCAGITAPACPLTGNPTTAGNYTFTVQVSDSNTPAQTAQRQFGVQITSGPPPQSSLTVEVYGQGTVASVSPGIDCGPDCAETYGTATTVFLNATAAPNWTFVGWVGCDSAIGTQCTVNVNAVRDVLATFYDPTILVLAQGLLVLPSPLNPSDFVVGNVHGAAEPNALGNFTIPVLSEGVTLTGAVPKSYVDGENVWMAVTLRTPAPMAPINGPPLVISAASTAEALVLIHPYFVVSDPSRLAVAMSVMSGLPEMQALENRIQSLYPNQDLPFSDAGFLGDYDAAVQKAVDSIPPVLTATPQGMELEIPGSAPGAVLATSPPVKSRSLDIFNNTLVKYQDSGPEGMELKIKSEIGTPLDTYFVVRQVDPIAVHEFRRDGSPTSQFSLTSVQDVLGQQNRILESQKEYPFYFALGNFEGYAVGKADSLFKYLDFIDLLIRKLIQGQILKVGAKTDTVDIPNDVGALYIIRGVTGRFASGNDRGEFGFIWNNYQDEFVAALVLNLINGGIDAVAILIDLTKLLDSCDWVKIWTDVSSKAYGYGDQVYLADLPPERILPLAWDLGKEVLKGLASCSVSRLVKSGGLTGVRKVFQSVVGTLNPLRKASKIGSLAERVVAISGFPFWVTPFPIFMTPADSTLVVIGDPFRPRGDRIYCPLCPPAGVDPASPATPLDVVGIGERITLEGKRFKNRPGDREPLVLVSDELGHSKALLNTTPVQDIDAEFPPTQVVSGDIPEGLAGRLFFSVAALGKSEHTPEVLEIEPEFLNMTPTEVFRTDPHIAHKRVIIGGRGFVPGRHLIGLPFAKLSPVSGGTDSQLSFDVPASAPFGLHEVKIEWGGGRTPVRGSDSAGALSPLMLRVLGVPVLDSVNPFNTLSLGIVTLNGKNFGTQANDIQLIWEPLSPSGPPETRTPTLVTWITGGGADLPGAMTAVQPLMDTNSNGPTSARVKVRTPEGDSNYLNFDVSDFPYEGAYYRELHVPRLSLVNAINYVNQNPAPGTSQNPVVQTASCDLGCVFDYPDDYLPITDIFGREFLSLGVSAPPGVNQSSTICGDPPEPFNCNGSSGPQTWEGLAPSQVQDFLSINPRSDYPGDISLAGAPIIRGENAFIFPLPNQYGRILHGGIIIEGNGKTGAPSDISFGAGIYAFPSVIEQATGTVITIRNANDVEVRRTRILGGPGCDIGVLVQNSRNIRIWGVEVQDCARPIVVENSEQVDISPDGVLNQMGSGYQTGITIDGGSHNNVHDIVLGYRLSNPNDMCSAVIPNGQGVAVHLKGGTSDNIVQVDEIVGSQVGVWIESGSQNKVYSSTLGLWANPCGTFQTTSSTGQPTRNAVGVKFSAGSSDNKLTRDQRANCAEPLLDRDVYWGGVVGVLGPNDTGVLMEGGQRNEVCGLGIGYAVGVNVPAGFGNNIGIHLLGAVNNQPSDNRIRYNLLGKNSADDILVENVTTANQILSNDFGIPAGTVVPDSEGFYGMRVLNSSGHLEVANNRFFGKPRGLRIEGSQNVRSTANQFRGSGEVGIEVRNSHTLRFIGDRVCGGTLSFPALNCAAQQFGQKGVHLVASSNLAFQNVYVEGTGGTGVEIEQPPANAVGRIRLEGQFPAGTQTAPPVRDDEWDPLNPPPQGGVSDSTPLVVRNHAGDGIYVHNGATGVHLTSVLITGNGGAGLHLNNPGDEVTLQQSRVGLDTAGATAGNLGDGVFMENSTSIGISIGGRRQGNIISGNGGYGIRTKDSTGIRVTANFIGSDPTGLLARPNAMGGVSLEDSNDTTIGGDNPDLQNLISGNNGPGVRVDGFLGFPAPPLNVDRNFIGVDATGSAALANSGDGVFVIGDGVQDGVVRITSNIVGGNGDDGVDIFNWVLPGLFGAVFMDGNILGRGTNPATGLPIGRPNLDRGVVVDASNGVLIQNNDISGNIGMGLLLTGGTMNTVVQANLVETSGLDGLVISGGSHTNTVKNNRILDSGADGVRVSGPSPGNQLTTNSITNNAAKGIALVAGGNTMIPKPTIRQVGRSGLGQYFVSGDVPLGVPDGSSVEVFADEGDEGRLYLTTAISAGHRFSAFGIKDPPGESLSGKKFHATVTDLNGNTSEFGDYDPDLTNFARRITTAKGTDVAMENVATRTATILVPSPIANPSLTQFLSSSVCEDISGQKFVVFVSDRDGNLEIYITDATGTNQTNLTNHPAEDMEPSLSPDCTRIAFVSNRDGNREVYTMNRDGTNLTRITNNTREDRQPDWSRDSTRLVISAPDAGGNFQLFTLNSSDGSNEVQQTNEAGQNRHPSWRRDEVLIAFENCTGSPPDFVPCQIGIINLSGSSVTYIPRGTQTMEQPEWLSAGDGAHYLLVSATDETRTAPYAIFLITSEGYILWQVSPDALNDRSPSCCLAP